MLFEIEPLDNVLYLFQRSNMNWKGAIEMNRAALIRIVAEVVALLAAASGSRLPLFVYGEIVRVLKPAESAVRRLILIAARGLDVQALPVRPMPKGLVIVRKTGARVSFPLFDTRKRFFESEQDIQTLFAPRIRAIDGFSPREMFLAQFNKPADEFCSEAESLRLSQRLNILQRALDHLPREAKRMARWLKRRETLKNPKFISPLRPGPPPGHQSRPREKIDHVLTEVHALAWDSTRLNTS